MGVKLNSITSASLHEELTTQHGNGFKLVSNSVISQYHTAWYCTIIILDLI